MNTHIAIIAEGNGALFGIVETTTEMDAVAASVAFDRDEMGYEQAAYEPVDQGDHGERTYHCYDLGPFDAAELEQILAADGFDEEVLAMVDDRAIYMGSTRAVYAI